MKFSSIKSFCRKKMLTVYVTLVGIFLQARQVQLQLDDCLQKTTSCPEYKQRWERRSKEFNCTQKDTNYTCLLTKAGQLVETCIFQINVGKGVVGCPFIMICLDGLPQVGTENNYMECPENIRWCPSKDHEPYTLYEMYKYPACFYHNKSEAIHIIPRAAETTVPISQTPYRIATAQSPTTQGSFPVFIVVITAIIVLVIAVLALTVWFKRCRSQTSSSSQDGESLPLMDSPAVRVKFVEDGKLEVIRDAPFDVSDRKMYYFYRKRENQPDWELLHTSDNYTRTIVLTAGIPIEEAVYYGVAVGQKGKITSTEYPMSEKMLKEKAKEDRYLKFQNDLYNKNNVRTKKIPIPSLRKGNAIHIDNLYSSVVVRTDKSHQRTKGIKERDVEQRVEHPRDIFYIGDKRTRYVFMIGLPARGKTAYCQWLTHKWCRARQKRLEKEDLDEWEKGLNEFDFLFFVQLRNISKVDSVSDIIYSDLFHNDSESRIFINEILDSDSRCLIIFDGLDELKSECTLPDMDKMTNCTFFISTRPWKFEDISHLIDDNDKVLEIKGLDENGIKNVTESLLCHHYKLSKDSDEYVRLNDVITRKSRIGAIKTFMHIPLLAITCVQVLYEHRDEGDIGTNVTDFYMDMIDLLIKRAREKEYIRYDSDEVRCPEFIELLTYRNKSLDQYSEVLMKLTKLAFDGLISEEKDKLVMNEDDLLSQIGEDHLQFALEVGLLSQSDENAYFNKVNVSISFFHKTVQEVLAAIHIAVNMKEMFKTYLTNVKTILEYSYVIMFISGLKPELGRSIIKHIADVLDKDAEVSKYRNKLLDMTDRSDISSLYRLQIDCFREIQYKKDSKGNKTNPQPNNSSTESYFVSDILLEDHDDDLIGDTAKLLRHHLPSIKSACFLRVPSRGESEIGDSLLTEFLDNVKTLTSLFIRGFEHGRILHHVRISTLTILSLMDVSISDVNPVDDAHSIVPLLTDMKSLQELKLSHVTLGNKVLGINAGMTQLKKVVFQWVKMSFWDQFFQSLIQIRHEYEVELSYSDADEKSMNNLYCSPHFEITWYGGKARTHFNKIQM